MSRLGFLRLLGLMPLTRYGSLGQPHQRVDQGYNPPVSPVAPTAAAGILKARQIIIFGTNDGLFLYNGIPSNSNPPVAYATAPGVTTDPFGNTLPVSTGGFTSVTSVAFTQISGGNVLIGVNGAPGRPSNLFSNSSSVNGSLAIDSGLDALGHHSATIELDGNATAADVAVVIAVDNAGRSTLGPLLEVQGAIEAVNSNISSSGLGVVIGGGGVNCGVGNLVVPQAGAGLRVKEGSNAKQGTATLVAGTAVVANTSVTASSRIFLTPQDGNTTGFVNVSARTAGTSFTMTSSNGADHGVVAYEIFEPA